MHLSFPRGEATVAFRTRPTNPRFDVDLSLRTVSRDNETESEWHKLHRAYHDEPYRGEIADYYVFSRYEGARIVDAYLIQTEWLMDCIWGDGDSPEDKYEERASEAGGGPSMADIDRAVVRELV